MNGLIQDVRYTLRQMRKNPGFTAAGILILALGIGANTAIFSAVYALLLNPFRFPESGRIVLLDARHISGNNSGTGYRDFLDWREQNAVFEEIAIMPWTAKYTLTGQGEPQSITGARTTPNLLHLLYVQPAAGRFFTADEDKPGSTDVLVLSYPAWQQRFAGDAGILGHSVTLNARPFTIVGILPRNFAIPGVETFEFLAPLMESHAADRYQHQYEVLARLKDGITIGQAQANMTAIARQLEQQYPETNHGWGIAVLPIREALAAQAGHPLSVLFSAVAFVLLLSCTNVAGLLLARASARTREIAIRISLGAGRFRIVRQMLTESVLLATSGGALGLVFAQWLMNVLRATAPPEFALDATLRLNPAVLAFTLIVSALTGIGFGLAPAWRATRPDLRSAVQSGSGIDTGGRERTRFLSCLVAGEVALSLVLLVAAGLLAKSLVLILRADTGLRTQHVLTFALNAPYTKYSSPQRIAQFYEGLLKTLQATPGISAAAAVSTLPMTGDYSGGGFEIEGKAKPADWMDVSAQYNIATPDYFHVLGIALMLGRAFDEHDTAGTLPVAIINDKLAKQFFASENPVGHRIKFGETWRTIVGVTGSVRHQQPMNEPVPMIYVPHAQSPENFMWVTVLSANDSEDLAVTVHKVVHSLDGDLPILKLRTMQEVVDDSVSEPSLIASFLAGFAGFSLALAAIGIYGLLAYSVTQRTHEMGVRLALGAAPADLQRLILRNGALLAGAGVALGIPASLALSRLLRSLLYRTSAHDPIVFAVVATLLLLVSLAASYIPARRAAKVDPMVALRYE